MGNAVKKSLGVVCGILLAMVPMGATVAAPSVDPYASYEFDSYAGYETVEYEEVDGGVLIGAERKFVRLAPGDKTLYKCFFAGGVQYETNLTYCRNVGVHMIQEGRVVARFHTDSNGRVYTGRNPSVGCLVALASGGFSIIAPGGGSVGWVAASWVLSALGIATSCH